MAQSTRTFSPTTTVRLSGTHQGNPKDERLHGGFSSLRFPIETRGVATSFRKQVLNYMYRTALGMSQGQLESAEVSLATTPDEEHSLQLDLTLTVNADWDAAQKLTEEILDQVSEWSQEWSEDEREDYGRWIYMGVIPAEL